MLTEPIPIPLRSDVVEAVVAGILIGDSIAMRSHLPEDGFDAYTYGTARWRLAWEHTERRLTTVPDVEALRRQPGQKGESLRIHADGFVAGIYAAGRDVARDPMAYNFDATPRRARDARANAQRTLFDPETILALHPETEAPEKLRDLHFVQAGDADAGGCQAIFLGAPLVDRLSGRSRWGWGRRLWRLGDDPSAFRVEPPVPGDPTPPYDSVEAPTLRLSTRDRST